MLAAGDATTSSSLIERARLRDPDAWNRLCLVYGPLVYRWARIVGLQDSDAADIGQEVFATVARRLETFDHYREASTFRGWLKTITRNKIGDHLKRRARREEAAGGSSTRHAWAELPEELSDAPVGAAAFDTERSILHRTLDVIRAEFEPRTWQAFWLSAVEDVTTQDIARQLEMTVKAVRQARYRVLRRLRVEIGNTRDQP